MRAPIGEAAAGALLVGVAVSPHAWGYEAALIAPFIWWALAGGIAEPWRTRSAIAAYVLAPFWLVSGWTQLSTVAIVVLGAYVVWVGGLWRGDEQSAPEAAYSSFGSSGSGPPARQRAPRRPACRKSTSCAADRDPHGARALARCRSTASQPGLLEDRAAAAAVVHRRATCRQFDLERARRLGALPSQAKRSAGVDFDAKSAVKRGVRIPKANELK